MKRLFPPSALLLSLFACLFCLGPALFAQEASRVATLVADDEPGERLHVSGTVYGSDGETPAAGAEIRVYQTDARGYYTPQDMMGNDRPRLQATFKTDAQGRYAFRTIKPGPYPRGGVAAHIHYVFEGGDGYRRQSFELHFAGDPELTETAIKRSERLGRFGTIRSAEVDADGVLQIVHDLRLRD